MYGGEVLKIWLKKIFNRILTLEEVPTCMKEGLVIPVYIKRQGKDPPTSQQLLRDYTLLCVIKDF